MRYVAQEVSAVDISRIIVLKSYRSACAVDEIYRATTTSLSYEFSVDVIIPFLSHIVNVFIKTPHLFPSAEKNIVS